jgi:hypothetical protein
MGLPSFNYPGGVFIVKQVCRNEIRRLKKNILVRLSKIKNPFQKNWFPLAGGSSSEITKTCPSGVFIAEQRCRRMKPRRVKTLQNLKPSYIAIKKEPYASGFHGYFYNLYAMLRKPRRGTSSPGIRKINRIFKCGN